MSYLQDWHDRVLKRIHEAAFGRRQATEEEIGQDISLLGTIRHLLGRR